MANLEKAGRGGEERERGGRKRKREREREGVCEKSIRRGTDLDALSLFLSL